MFSVNTEDSVEADAITYGDQVMVEITKA
jgi:hypothetical protein